MKIRLLLVAVTLICTAALTNRAFAAEVPNVAASPSIVEKVVDPKSSASFSVNLSNLSDSPLPLYVSSSPYDINGYNDSSAVNWFSFEEPDLLLLPRQTLTETVNVSVPANVEAGSHYASLNFTPLVPVDTLKQNNAAVVLRLSVTAVIIVRGNIIEKASLSKISEQMPLFGGPVSLSVPVNNEGNVHLLPHGMLNIYKDKRLVKSFPISGHVIFPGNKYIFSESWDKHAFLGSYQAQAFLTYGSTNQQTDSKILSFSVMPWPLLIFIICALALFLILFKFTRHRWKRALKALLFEYEKGIDNTKSKM